MPIDPVMNCRLYKLILDSARTAHLIKDDDCSKLRERCLLCNQSNQHTYGVLDTHLIFTLFVPHLPSRCTSI
jgi:hypothetical protein